MSERIQAEKRTWSDRFLDYAETALMGVVVAGYIYLFTKIGLAISKKYF